MPKIFLSNAIRDGNTYRIVIDGQQRITAILDFLRDQFSLDKPYEGDNKGRKFSQLTEETQESVLSYRIDFNEAYNTTDEENRAVFLRVNKYTVPLNRQELRRADYPGDFLSVAEELAINDQLDTFRVFTPGDRRRHLDVEYVSELMAGMIAGIQDKKKTLDGFYVKYGNWEEEDKARIRSRFASVLEELSHIFDESLDMSKTRWRQKADFYTMFLVIDEHVSEGRGVREAEVEPLREDLRILDFNIRPGSSAEVCSEYAIKCVSQGNSASSRRWRFEFLGPIFAGTYTCEKPDPAGARVFYRLMEDLGAGDAYCPAPVFECVGCGGEITGDFSRAVLVWSRCAMAFQISNAEWMHLSCSEEAAEWVVLERPGDE